jgi:hypothetical protein
MPSSEAKQAGRVELGQGGVHQYAVRGSCCGLWAQPRAKLKAAAAKQNTRREAEADDRRCSGCHMYQSIGNAIGSLF